MAKSKVQDLRDASGDVVDARWLARQAVQLLEKAQLAEQPEHTACVKYLELLAKVLLPKSHEDTRGAAATQLLEQARAIATQERQQRLGIIPPASQAEVPGSSPVA
jgi:hypothetical protein